MYRCRQYLDKNDSEGVQCTKTNMKTWFRKGSNNVNVGVCTMYKNKAFNISHCQGSNKNVNVGTKMQC